MIGPVAAPHTVAATTAPTATKAATKPPVAAPPVPPAKPGVLAPVTSPQVGGTVAKRAYMFKVARGDTLWDLSKQALHSTGRSTSNANVASYLIRFYQHNRGMVGTNPNVIQPGQTVVWPAGL